MINIMYITWGKGVWAANELSSLFPKRITYVPNYTQTRARYKRSDRELKRSRKA
jgi:hypothetical protein